MLRVLAVHSSQAQGLGDIGSAHSRVADAHGVEVAPVGLAMDIARRRVRSRSDAWGDVGSVLDLLDPDDEHPSVQGSYLQALTVAAVLAGTTPSSFLADGHWRPRGLEDGLADFLCEVASEAIAQWAAAGDAAPPVEG